MAILYKTFKPARIVFYALFIGFLCAPQPAPAQPNPYVIEGIQVDITADNAINARNQAFEKAQQDAVMALAAQFFAPAQLATFRAPPASSISPMIQDYEVTKEKLSSKRYIGTYTFRFKRSALSQFFNSAGMDLAAPAGPMPSMPGGITETFSPTTTQARNVLILPFYQVGNQTILSSGYNSWMQAWRRTASAPALVLPLGDLADTADIGDNEALSYDPQRLARMLARYSAREAVVAIAIPDAALAAQTLDSETTAGSLRVNVYRTDRMDGPEQTGQFVVNAMQGERRSQVFDRAALQVQQILQSEWKNTNYVPVATASNTIEMRVPFSNLQEWAVAQRKLTRIQGVNDIVLKSLSAREARIGVVYEGDADTLRIALQQIGMDLSSSGAGAYDLSLNPAASPYGANAGTGNLGAYHRDFVPPQQAAPAPTPQQQDYYIPPQNHDAPPTRVYDGSNGYTRSF